MIPIAPWKDFMIPAQSFAAHGVKFCSQETPDKRIARSTDEVSANSMWQNSVPLRLLLSLAVIAEAAGCRKMPFKSYRKWHKQCLQCYNPTYENCQIPDLSGAVQPDFPDFATSELNSIAEKTDLGSKWLGSASAFVINRPEQAEENMCK